MATTEAVKADRFAAIDGLRGVAAIACIVLLSGVSVWIGMMAHPTKVLLLGDSTRMGYEDWVRAELGSGFTVITSGKINCTTSRSIKNGFLNWGRTFSPDVVVINCGLHDILRQPEWGGQTQISTSEYRRNLQLIISSLRKNTNARLIWVRTTPVVEGGRAGMGNADISEFNNIADAVVAERLLESVDAHRIVSANMSYISADSIHLTPDGSRALARAIAEKIRTDAK